MGSAEASSSMIGRQIKGVRVATNSAMGELSALEESVSAGEETHSLDAAYRDHSRQRVENAPQHGVPREGRACKLSK